MLWTPINYTQGSKQGASTAVDSGVEKNYFESFYNPEQVVDKITRMPYGTDSDDCLLCGRPLLRENFRDAVRDHCHFTGKFRGAVHSKCNINHFRLKPDQVPIPLFSTTWRVTTVTW